MEKTTPRPWFGPHRLGWGWSPASPEGWVVTAVFGLLAFASARALRDRTITGVLAFVVSMTAFVLIAMVTGGPPGSALFTRADRGARQLERG